MAFDISADEQELVDAVTQISRDVLAPQAAAADANERVSDDNIEDPRRGGGPRSQPARGIRWARSRDPWR